LSAAPANGQEPEVLQQPAVTTHLSGEHGLTGFGTMVDGRVPTPFLAEPEPDEPLGAWSSRFSLRYALFVQRRDLHGVARAKSRDEQHALTAMVGANVQGLDLAIGLPYRYRAASVSTFGASRTTDHDDGLGDLRVGAKVAFRVPKFFFGDWAVAALAPYGHGRVPTSRSPAREPGEFDLGVALAGPYGYSFRWLGNLAWRYREGGLHAIVYRFGASAVPVATAGCAVRVYGHIAGVDYGGANSDVDLEGGAQFLFGGRVTVDLGLSYRVIDSGFVSRELRHSLARDFGAVPGRSEDEGTFSVTFAIGVVL
jgi:hypothetical protein